MAHTTINIDASVINAIIDAIENDKRILFAYFYGSAEKELKGNDIDIAVYAKSPVNANQLSADLKIRLHKLLGLPPDIFDIRVLNDLVDRGNIFDLLYLKNVLTDSRLLMDKDPEIRGNFLEQYGFKYRECEGLIKELLA